MSDPIRDIKIFLQCFDDYDENQEVLWLIYQAALNSDLSEGWDNNQRADYFCFLSNLDDFMKGMLILSKRLLPLLDSLPTNESK